MIAGRLNDFITLYAPTEASDGFGSSVVTYAPTKRIRAEVRFKGGRMSVETSELFSDNGLEVFIRSAHTIESHWRIRYEGEDYVVNAVEQGRSKGYKRLLCDKVNL